MPMMASAFLTNPNSATDRNITATVKTVDSNSDFISSLLSLLNSKFEYRNPKQFSKLETQKTNHCETEVVWNIGAFGHLIFVSSFEFRGSNSPSIYFGFVA